MSSDATIGWWDVPFTPSNERLSFKPRRGSFELDLLVGPDSPRCGSEKAGDLGVLGDFVEKQLS